MFQLLLLGEPVLLDTSAEPVPLWRPAVALFALAASAGGSGVPRERAAGMIWPDLDDARARRALRQVLHRIRHDTGELLVGDRTAIALDSDRVAVDLLDFEAHLDAGDAAAAADLYRGDLLAGFCLPDSAAFEHWADGRRQRLRARVCDALDALVQAAVSAGDWAEALRRAEQRLEIDPLSERAAARLVALHHQRGDRARALALSDAFTARFVEQLGAAPDGELAALARRIRESPIPVGAPTSATPVHAGATVQGATPEGTFQLPLVGRTVEFARLMEEWQAARGGHRRVVLLEGDEGAGKTRLADELRRWLQAGGATTLWCRAYEIERGIPYATLAGALREALHAPGLAGVDERTPLELARIVPDFARRFSSAHGAAATSQLEAGRLRIVDAVRDVIDSLAWEQPLLLVVDDVQWADDASLAALNYVCRALPQSPWLLLLTARTADLTPTAGALQLVDGMGDGVLRMTLRPLDESAIRAALVASGATEADAAERAGALLAETGGNALFVNELLRGGARPGLGGGGAHMDDRLAALGVARLARLPAAARRLLEAAAVIGRAFPLRLASSSARLDPGAATDAIDMLQQRGLLRQVGYGYDFVHGLLRAQVLGTMGPARLAELHAEVYAQLEPSGSEAAEDIGVDRANALAHHAARAGLQAHAHRWYMHAADRAIRLFAGEEAESALRAALANAADADARRATHVQLGHVAWIRSRYADAAREYDRALALSDDAGERLRLRIRMLDAGLRGGVLQVADADDLAPVLLREASEAGGAALRDLLTALAWAYDSAGRRTEATDCAERAVAAARDTGDAAPLVAALLLATRLTARSLAVSPADSAAGSAAPTATRAEPPDPDPARPVVTSRPLAWLNEALQVARAHDLTRERFDTQIELGTELSRIGRWEDAVTELRRVYAAAERYGEPGVQVVAAINLSDLLVRRGEWAEASALLDAGDRLVTGQDFPHAAAAMAFNRALLYWLRGDDDAAILGSAEVAATRAAAAGLRAVERAARAVIILNRLGAHDDDRAFAESRLMEGLAHAAHANWADDQELAVVAAARIARAHGDPDTGRARLQMARRAAVSACGSAILRLELTHCTADTAGPGGEHAAALATLERLGAHPLGLRLCATSGHAAGSTQRGTSSSR
jgi:DNA-binding SARP family transcriptional activator/tetratricopeptide (TPR) repeat protein